MARRNLGRLYCFAAQNHPESLPLLGYSATDSSAIPPPHKVSLFSILILVNLNTLLQDKYLFFTSKNQTLDRRSPIQRPLVRILLYDHIRSARLLPRKIQVCIWLVLFIFMHITRLYFRNIRKHPLSSTLQAGFWAQDSRSSVNSSRKFGQLR